MCKWSARLLLLLPALYATGCGTLGNTIGIRYPSEHLRVYGGVQLDVEQSQERIAKAKDAKTTNERAEACVGLFLMTVDMPFSAIADTLTLPFTIPEAIDRTRHPENYWSGPARPAPSEPDLPTSP
jgi:uncharacterized protein YceK